MEQSHVILIVIIAITFILLYMAFSEKKTNKYYCEGNVCKLVTDKNYSGKTYDDDVCGGNCNEEPPTPSEKVEIYILTGNNSQISDTINEDGSATVKLDSVLPSVLVMTAKNKEPVLKETISLDEFLNDDIWNDIDGGAVVIDPDTKNEISYGIQLVDKPLFSSGTIGFNCKPLNQESMDIMSTLKGVVKGMTMVGFTILPKNN